MAIGGVGQTSLAILNTTAYSTASASLDQNTGDTDFGQSVAMTDNWAIVGAFGAKKAFIFKTMQKLSTITGASAGDFLVLSVASGKSLQLSTGGNIKMGAKDIVLNGDNGDTVSLLYDGNFWLITSLRLN